MYAGKRRAAHRVSAALFLGFDIESELCVCHACDVPKCVNPKHLFVATQAENLADRDAKGRTARGLRANGNPARGRANGNAKLCEEDVALIRDAVAQGIPKRFLARSWGIAPVTVRQIVRRDTWKAVA